MRRTPLQYEAQLKEHTKSRHMLQTVSGADTGEKVRTNSGVWTWDEAGPTYSNTRIHNVQDRNVTQLKQHKKSKHCGLG